MDAKGNITVKSDAVKQVLEYSQKLVKVMPQDVFAWDDASNNKYLISGQGSLIMNPPWPTRSPSATTRKSPSSSRPSRCPRGPKGRFAPYLPFIWGVWEFSKNKAPRRACCRPSGSARTSRSW